MAIKFDFGEVLMNAFLRRKQMEQEDTQFNETMRSKEQYNSIMDRYYSAQTKNWEEDNIRAEAKDKQDTLNKMRDDARLKLGQYTNVYPEEFGTKYKNELIQGGLLQQQFKDYPDVSSGIKPEGMYARKSDVDEYYKGYNAETSRINANKQGNYYERTVTGLDSGGNPTVFGQIKGTPKIEPIVTPVPKGKGKEDEIKADFALAQSALDKIRALQADPKFTGSGKDYESYKGEGTKAIYRVLEKVGIKTETLDNFRKVIQKDDDPETRRQALQKIIWNTKGQFQWNADQWNALQLWSELGTR